MRKIRIKRNELPYAKSAKVDMETNVNITTEPKHDAKLPIIRGAFYWAVTGTFHGSIIEAETEGEARRIFHNHYNGESIIYIKKRSADKRNTKPSRP